MKMLKLKIWFLLLFWIPSVYGQDSNFEIGLVAGYNWITPEVRSAISDRYNISGSSGLDGYEVGVTGVVEKNKWMWVVQLTYLMNRSNLEIKNLKWQDDYSQFGAASISSGIGITSRMVRVSVDRGYFFAKNFSINGGLICIIQIDDQHYKIWPEDVFYDYQKDISHTIFEFANSINRYMLSGEVELKYHFGPLACFIAVEKNFTPVISNVSYKAQMYPVRYNYVTWTVGVNYTVFESKR